MPCSVPSHSPMKSFIPAEPMPVETMNSLTVNPKGITPQSPGLPSLRGYPGIEACDFPNPERVTPGLRSHSVHGKLLSASNMHCDDEQPCLLPRPNGVGWVEGEESVRHRHIAHEARFPSPQPTVHAEPRFASSMHWDHEPVRSPPPEERVGERRPFSTFGSTVHGERTKLLIITLIGLSAFTFLFGCSRKDAENAAATPETKEVSRASHGTNGDPIVKLDAKTQKLIGLQTAALSPAELRPEIKGYGRLLD